MFSKLRMVVGLAVAASMTATTVSSFCPTNHRLATIPFDYTSTWQPVRTGYLNETDDDVLGFGFGVNVVPGRYVGPTNCPISVNTTQRYDNVLQVPTNMTHSHIQHEEGGPIYITFSNRVSIYSVTVVDLEGAARVVTFGGGGRHAVNLEAPQIGKTEMVVSRHDVRKMRVRLFGRGAVSQLKLCKEERSPATSCPSSSTPS